MYPSHRVGHCNRGFRIGSPRVSSAAGDKPPKVLVGRVAVDSITCDSGAAGRKRPGLTVVMPQAASARGQKGQVGPMQPEGRILRGFETASAWVYKLCPVLPAEIAQDAFCSLRLE
jgi:hypothetical protein